MIQEIPSYYLYPASLFSHKEPHLVNTILGSCVSVCLYDNNLKIGGINHYMLPFWNGQELASPKYGNIAVEKLLNNMLEMGCNKKSIVAKIFGGAEVLQTKKTCFNIGSRNIELAYEMLAKYNIPIVASSVGGKEGRKIQFMTNNGSVKMKYVKQVSNIAENSKVNI